MKTLISKTFRTILLGFGFLILGFCATAQSGTYRLAQPLPYIADSVRFISWKLIDYPQSNAICWKLIQDSTSTASAMEGNAAIPDNLRIYLGGPNENRIPRWLDSTAIWTTKQD